MTKGILGPGIDDSLVSRKAAASPVVRAQIGMRVMHRGSRFIGRVIGFVGEGVTLQGASSDERSFRFTPGGFLVDATIVTLDRSVSSTPSAPVFTASGSVAAPTSRAKVAKASRIWVEGIHDAALVEKIWGDDLREAGIVVERLDGLDDLAAEIERFQPTHNARLGVLVDHLLPGTKEWRIAAVCRSDVVAITGHPYVDVWQSVRPQVLGIERWPEIPRDEDWKQGICRRVGSRLGASDPLTFWRELLKRTSTFADLEPTFIGAVESLLDVLLAE